MADLRFTDDVYDPVKMAMSGCKLGDLLDFSRPAVTWFMAITKQGNLRVMRGRGVSLNVSGHDRDLLSLVSISLAGHQAQLWRNKSIIEQLDITVHSDPEEWRSFFFAGDKEWDKVEKRLIENSDQWTKTTSILKTTLCPPICSASSGK
jgi:hypothetical protein